ncbi:translocation protein Sec62 [Paraphysoderma sedebokerense]|nr:translocation protein Sec62 [Paraphysoderma sedebokerense]
MTYIYSILLVVIVLAGVMFPLWPDSLRQGVWYLSMGSLGLLGLLMVIAVIRLIVFLLTVVVGKGIWIFPNLFADVGIIDSFKPAWEWHVTEKQLKEKKSPKGKAKKTKSSGEE